jgi:hypothetical protein
MRTSRGETANVIGTAIIVGRIAIIDEEFRRIDTSGDAHR